MEVVEVAKGFLSLVAKENILAGSFLADVWGPVVSQATPYTIQVDVNKHVDPVGPLKRTNHSCNPNAKFVYEPRLKEDEIMDFDKDHKIFWHLVATRDIKEGEDITFDYTTTEYEMAGVFNCLCGMENCLGEVKGFKFLSAEEKAQREKELSPVMRKLSSGDDRVYSLTDYVNF